MWTPVALCLITAAALAIAPARSEENSATLMASRISDFKKDVHRMLEGTRIRKKRQLDQFGDPSDYRLRFDSVTPEDLPYLSDFNLTFWIPVSHQHTSQVLFGTNEGNLLLFQLPHHDDKTAEFLSGSAEPEDVAVKAVAFSHYDEQWFCVLHTSSEGYYIRMYQRVGRVLERRQKIVLTGPSDMQLITLKGVHYLAVATYQATITQGLTYQGSVVLYHWLGTQLNEIATRITHGARSLDCWVMGGSIYLAVGQEVNDEGNHKVGSPIFFYNSKEENRLVLWEMLSTFGPSKVRHFQVAGSHYVIFIGMKDAVIYWWLNGQFLEWQTLSGTAFASDLSILYLGDGEVSIVIGLKEEALFYTLDGSGHYTCTFTMSFKERKVASLQFMYSGNAYYALALFAEAHNVQSIWRLTVGYEYLPSVKPLDSLQQCLLDTQELLKERQHELEAINADLGRVWLRGSNQTITAKIIVKGKVTSTRVMKAKDIIIVRYTKLPDCSMDVVITALVQSKDAMDDVNYQLRGVVYKSARQEIKGTKYFRDSIYVPSLTLDPVDVDMRINEVTLERLKNYALRKIGNQVFPSTAVISNVHTETASVGTLNGIPTNDLLLLHGDQEVTGDLTFSDLKGINLSTHTINYIPVEDIVTTTSTQEIKDLKVLNLLQSDIIDVRGETNGVKLKDAAQKIALLDSYGEFKGRLTFNEPLTVHGDLFLTGQVNKVIDLSRLVSHSVTLDTQQDLTGLYRMKAGGAIGGDLLVAGTVNGVTMDNLMTLSSSQKIYADMTFTSPLTFTRDLLVDYVNDVDLSDQVLKKWPPYQFVTGQKTFAKNIVADFVDMTEYVTLDGVDPSFLDADIIQHKQGVVKSNATSFKDIVILGNVTALGGVNGYDVQDLIFSVWLKNVEQDISGPLHAYSFHFKNDLDATTVNNYNLDTDVVHSFQDEAVISSKSFQNKITVRSLKTTGDAAVNGINPYTLKIELERYENENAIHGTKTLNSMEIYGDLKTKKLNDVNASEMMQPHAHQNVYGTVEFASELAPISGNMEAVDLSFDKINDFNLKDYYFHAVLASDLSGPVINKNFAHLKATNLSVPLGSTINGMCLHDLGHKVVTLNTPQLITSAKSFESANFEKLISLSTLNGLELSRYIDEVVLTDEVSKISNKHFANFAGSTNAFVRGTVNGIKIEDMAANVFYKSQDNEVDKLFLFKNDVDIGDLVTSSALDGVEWNNLIFIKKNEVLGPGFFLSNIVANSDVFIRGLLNGCDLSELASRAVYANKSMQVIKEHINVQNIVVVGNIYFQDDVNKISIEQLRSFITTTGDQEITSDIVIEANFEVENLYLREQASSSKIAEIVKDAVRHSISQVIKGQKTFKDDLSVNVLAGGDVFAHQVNGIILEELHRKTVWKNGHQEVHGDKIFALLHSDVATVEGYLNGLILPRDVVLTDSSEHISHPTYFMSDVFVTTDLIVYGMIDGVDIDALISNRVTRSGNQNLTAQLTFLDDVVLHDEMTIDGTINEIVLELAAKVKSDQPLQGYKVFVDLQVAGPLSAASVNGHDVPELAAKTLKYNKDDYINGVQVFEKPIEADSSLFVDWVNDVPLRKLTDTFDFVMGSFKTVLNYLEDFSFSLQQLISNQMSATQEQVSRFAYFVLFQEINMGPTTKILNGFALQQTTNYELSHSMVMWTKQKHCVYMEKCCHLEFSYWMKVKKDGIVMVDATPESGRYYPIYDSAQSLKEKKFFIWSNTTDVQPKWCNKNENKMFLASYNYEGLLDVSIEIEGAPLISEMKSFRKDHLYAVAAFYYDTEQDEYSTTTVYVYHEFERHWSRHQILSSFGVLSLDVIDYADGYRNEILLALGTGIDAVPATYSTVYRWNNKDQMFEPFQNIPSRHVTSTLWIRKNRELLLSMSSVDHWPGKHVDCSETVSGGAIDIYAYKEQLQWIQSIPLSGVISMASFSVDGDVFLAAASSQQQTIYIYEWQGYAAFVQIQSMFVGEVKHISVYTIDEDTYMTVALNSGPSKILKMIRKGHHRTSNFDANALVMEDEGAKEAKYIAGC